MKAMREVSKDRNGAIITSRLEDDFDIDIKIHDFWIQSLHPAVRRAVSHAGKILRCNYLRAEESSTLLNLLSDTGLILPDHCK